MYLTYYLTFLFYRKYLFTTENQRTSPTVRQGIGKTTEYILTGLTILHTHIVVEVITQWHTTSCCLQCKWKNL